MQVDETRLTIALGYGLFLFACILYVTGVVVRAIVKKFKCQHVFKGPDLQPRDTEGFVSWPCSNCGKIFKEPCGLDIGRHGKITGPWGSTKE